MHIFSLSHSKGVKIRLVEGVAYRDDAHADSALVRAHGRYKRPGVRGGVVGLDGGEVGHAVVPSYRPQSPHIRHQRNSAPHHVHRRHKLPSVKYDIVVSVSHV